MDFPETINERAILERTKSEGVLEGTVTEVIAGNPPRVRIDGKPMRVIVPGIKVGDRGIWLDQPDNPVCIGKTLDDLGGAIPNIWTCTSLRLGDTTWTSALGDVRTLHADAARHTADGGLSLEPNVLCSLNVYAPYPAGDDLGSSTAARWDLDITTWWDTPSGEDTGDYSHPYIYDWNFVWAVVPPDWWAAGDPLVPTLTDGAASPLANGIALDPSTVGSSGYDRLFLRIEYNPSTGAAEAWLATIDDVTFSLVSQGTATFAAATPGQGVTFDADNNLDGSLLTGWAPLVVHGCVVRQPSNGAMIHGFQVNNLDNARPVYTAGRQGPTHRIIGTSVVVDGTSFYQSYDSDYLWAPGGAPLWMGLDDGGFRPIWTDGGDLVSPVIAASNKLTPGKLEVVSGVQPYEFVGTGSDDGWFVAAVADAATAGSLDSNGWPLNWWPFGSLLVP